MEGRRNRPSPLHGSARGVLLVVLLGLVVLLVGLALTAVLTWVMT